MLAAGVFISPDSFWIDEGNTAYKASQPTLSAWFHALTAVSSSDAQMPGYMIYLWMWEKIAGHSEFALRLSNLPWLALIVMSLRRFPFAILFALTSPFILNYLGELRPYLMQISGAALAVNGLSRIAVKPASGWRRSLAGCLIMSASSLLGVVWSLGALIYVIVENSSRLKCPWFWRGCLTFLPAFGILGTYYAWTLAEGQGAALMGGGFIVSAAAVAYELLGLAGLGPEKVRLRVDPKSLLEYAWILIPAALTTGGLILWGCYQWSTTTPRRRFVAVVCGVGIPILMLLTLLVFKDFRVLGRHFAPMAPLLILLLARTSTLHPGSRQAHLGSHFNIAVIAVWLVIAIGLASSLSLRFAPRHRKDDYRTAASIARNAIKQKTPVIWVADRWTGYFYGLDEAHSGWQPWRDSMPLPILDNREIVILTKPDIYDSKGGLRALLMQRGFIPIRQLPAFTVFEHPTSSQIPQ